MALTPERRIILQARLDAAEAAYDKLMSGKAVRVLVDQNGERIEFTPANAGRLAAYILELQTLLGIARTKIVGPMRTFL